MEEFLLKAKNLKWIIEKKYDEEGREDGWRVSLDLEPTSYGINILLPKSENSLQEDLQKLRGLFLNTDGIAEKLWEEGKETNREEIDLAVQMLRDSFIKLFEE